MPAGPPPDVLCNHLVVHGGVGDQLWVFKKLVNAGRPLFVSVANEGRYRPRRTGHMLDHLPFVYGWRYDETTFCPGGQDWGSADDPACAMFKTWADLAVAPNVPVRLECNRWLESGRRIEDWLPDLATTHHYPFTPPAAKPTRAPAERYVVMHVAGWPDVTDLVWAKVADLFRGVARVYVVGGTYDVRTQQVYNYVTRTNGGDGVVPLLDLDWPDFWHTLMGAELVFGHASGLTILADVLKRPGVTVNPRAHPKLVHTWNSRENSAMVQAATQEEFLAAVGEAAEAVGGRRPVWPPGPTPARGYGGQADSAKGAVYAMALHRRPASVLVYAAASDRGAAAVDAVLHGVYDGDRVVSAVTLCCPAGIVPVMQAAATAARRCSRPPAIGVVSDLTSTDTTYEAAVIDLTGAADPTRADRAVRGAWAQVCAGGLLMVTAHPAAAAAVRGAKPAKTQCGGWYYLHKT